MTGVPGGDVTLHAAITETLMDHQYDGGVCDCGFNCWEDRNSSIVGAWAAHQAERVLAVLADRLPHTPAEQLAALIGGTVERGVGWTRPGAHEIRAVTPWVPDSPPAAPEPGQDT